VSASARTGAATWAALTVVYLVWGSTYLAIRVLVRTTPPLLAMGVRFTTAGLLLAAFLAARHGPGVLRVPWRRALPAAVVGVLLLGGGNGGIAVAEQVLPPAWQRCWSPPYRSGWSACVCWPGTGRRAPPSRARC